MACILNAQVLNAHRSEPDNPNKCPQCAKLITADSQTIAN